MRVHFFNRIDTPNRSSFRSYCTLQNLLTVKIVSVIYFLINALIRLIVVINDLPIQGINHINEYSVANWFSLAVTPIFCITSILFIRSLAYSNKLLIAAQGFVLVFALFIVISSMRSTFIVMHNPRNSMVMYLIGLIIASIFYTFEYFETLFLTIVAGTCFTLLLPFYQHGFNELLMNNFASLILLSVFFCISRYSFSYRADNFLKLRAIEEKNIEIETASKVKNEILGIVAHDLRNPLSAVKTLAMLMEMDENMNEDNLDNLQMIKTSCDKATFIINDLLETAHNEKAGEYDMEVVELNQFVLLIVDEWVKNKTGIVKLLYYGTNHPVHVTINREKMQRVMDNLISNAIKFSDESDHIEISLRTVNSDVFIDVKDFGLGIPSDLLPYVFDRFSRASRKGIRGEESVGLGLSIVRQIVRKHGGEIEVYSAEGIGTTFTIKMTCMYGLKIVAQPEAL